MESEHQVVAMERAALARWLSGDPTGFLEISAPDVVYFDPMTTRQIDGLDALTAYYAPLKGTIFAPRFELLNPLVQQLGDDAAVLTFNFVSYAGSEGGDMHWNCTEVYRRAGESWRIIQTHWSFTRRL